MKPEALLSEVLSAIRQLQSGSGTSFALGLALLTGFFCGLAPAFAAIRTSVNETLKEGGRTGTSGGGHTRLHPVYFVHFCLK